MNVGFRCGIVRAYWDKTKVAIIELSDDLAIGEMIKFTFDGRELFEQSVEGLYINRDNVKLARRGQLVALKTVNEIPKEAQVFKVRQG